MYVCNLSVSVSDGSLMRPIFFITLFIYPGKGFGTTITSTGFQNVRDGLSKGDVPHVTRMQSEQVLQINLDLNILF